MSLDPCERAELGPSLEGDLPPWRGSWMPHRGDLEREGRVGLLIPLFSPSSACLPFCVQHCAYIHTRPCKLDVPALRAQHICGRMWMLGQQSTG